MSDPQEYRPKEIPSDPGVYRFFDANDRVIYVGKARNLKSRLTSYFQSNLTEKTNRMVHTAVRVDWTIVGSEVEALQLEYTWIKSEAPRFNIQFRDDKSYPYLALSIDSPIPRLFIARGKKRAGVKYFGPFAHAWALRSTFDLLQKIYPVRTCTDTTYQRAEKSKRQCLLGDIGKCAAPCVQWVSTDQHHEIAENLVKFLETNPGKIESRLEREMNEAAEREEYEQAGKIRDQLAALRRAMESSSVALSENLTADFVALHQDITHSAVSIFSVHEGRITASRSWIMDLSEVPEDESVVEAALARIYADFDIPREIFINSESDSEGGIAEWLGARVGHSVKISMPLRGEKVELLQTVTRNAQQALISYLSKRSTDAAVSGKALQEIAEYLELAELPLRIECFDISNIQGTTMVASMVVFEDGQAKKSEYRRFAIDDSAGFDDTRAMHHVLTRRLKRLINESKVDTEQAHFEGAQLSKFAYPPQLIVVDGGAPQVAAAQRALEELGISRIALCGLAKRLEEVWLPHSSDPVILPRHSEGLYLLQRIRDEAHRFAITFHRSKRSRLMVESILDEIPGLGSARTKALLDHYGSVAALRKSSVSQISQVPGIGEGMAQTIWKHLHQHEHLNEAQNETALPKIDMKTGEILE